MRTLEHTETSHEMIVVVLTNCATEKDHLIQVIDFDKDQDVKLTAVLQSKKIVDVSARLKIDIEKVIGLVFDRTSIN